MKYHKKPRYLFTNIVQHFFLRIVTHKHMICKLFESFFIQTIQTIELAYKSKRFPFVALNQIELDTVQNFKIKTQ